MSVEKLALLLCGIAIGFYAHSVYGVFKKKLDKKREGVLQEFERRNKKEVRKVIQQALDAEDGAYEILRKITRKARLRIPFKPGEAWDLMREMRNRINEYSGLCGRAEDLLGPEPARQAIVASRKRLDLEREEEKSLN